MPHEGGTKEWGRDGGSGGIRGRNPLPQRMTTCSFSRASTLPAARATLLTCLPQGGAAAGRVQNSQAVRAVAESDPQSGLAVLYGDVGFFFWGGSGDRCLCCRFWEGARVHRAERATTIDYPRSKSISRRFVSAEEERKCDREYRPYVDVGRLLRATFALFADWIWGLRVC